LRIAIKGRHDVGAKREADRGSRRVHKPAGSFAGRRMVDARSHDATAASSVS
jgi:hypothetical protein